MTSLLKEQICICIVQKSIAHILYIYTTYEYSPRESSLKLFFSPYPMFCLKTHPFLEKVFLFTYLEEVFLVSLLTLL